MPKSQNFTETKNTPTWSDLITPYSDKSFDTNDPEIITRIIRQLRMLEQLGVNIADLGKMDPKLLEKVKSKTAYPNLEQMQNIPGTHDMSKWLQAVKDIYYETKKHQVSRNVAIRHATQGWKITEVNDFLNWLRYYEEGTHLKYKIAQNWYGDADIGYLLPIKPDKKEEEKKFISGKDIDFARDAVVDELSAVEKKRIIEKQRNKIIGRLDSAEKLLRSQDGQIFADKEFASLLETIYDLKKKIQMVNKRSSSDKLYADMIIREANKLTYKGFVKAADMLHSLANGAPPTATPPAPPMQGSGNVGGLPATTPGTTTPAPGAAPTEPEDPESEGIKQFLDKLETGNITSDILEVMDDEDALIVEDDELVSTAQEIPPPPPSPPPQKPDEEIEINEENVGEELKPSKDFDRMVESIFTNLTISDVVAKFEDIAKFYKTREMPRQLAMADMMLDSLGLAPFFPSLSEATNKALEANNYISTRLEDIISKLRGTMKTRDIDVQNEEEKPKSPAIEQAKKSLQEQDEKEIARKQMRKDLENESLQNDIKETPEVELEGLENPPPPSPPVPVVKPPAA